MGRTLQSSRSYDNIVYLKISFEYTILCKLQSRARTHAVMVIGLYELLGNPTT
jgi:hypothetical protein